MTEKGRPVAGPALFRGADRSVRLGVIASEAKQSRRNQFEHFEIASSLVFLAMTLSVVQLGLAGVLAHLYGVGPLVGAARHGGLHLDEVFRRPAAGALRRKEGPGRQRTSQEA